MNMFDEFSMIAPGPLVGYVGFTEEEAGRLCEQYDMDMQEVLNAIWMKRPEQVAEGIRQAHFETSYIYSKKKISGKAGTGRRA